MTHIVFVRHGTTEWMEEGRLHGVRNSPLSERGRQEATLTAQYLASREFDAFYTSPIGRAEETAGIIAERANMEPQILEGLREINFGIMEGMRSVPGPRGRYKPWQKLMWIVFARIGYVTGDIWAKTMRRARAVLDHIHANHPGEKVLVVTHGGIYGAMMRVTFPSAQVADRFWYPLDPCGISEIELSDHGPARALVVNSTAHLEGL